MSLPLLQVEGLCVEAPGGRRPVRLLDDVALALHRGEVLAVIGERGAGKSTLARALLGLVDRPARIVGGQMAFDGRDLRAIPRPALRALRGARIALLEDLTSAFDTALRIGPQMLDAVLAHPGAAPSSARERASAALVAAGIAVPDAVLEAWPLACPPGVRTRAALAMMLVNAPDLIVADEPFRSCDPTLARQVGEVLYERVTDTGAAMLWLTNDPTALAKYAQRACILYAGRVVEEGSVAALTEHPLHPYTRALMDAALSRAPPGVRLRTVPGVMPARATLPLGCAFRERCASAIDACLAPPALQPSGVPGAWRAVRCHNPLPLAALAT